MAATINAFGSFAETAMKAGILALDGATNLKAMLTTDAPNLDTWQTFSDVTGEIADASYTAGGNALANVAVTEALKVAKLDADDTVFTALNKNFRYAIVYQDAGAKPLILAYDDGGTRDVESAGPQDVTLQWAAAGLLSHTVA